MDMYYIKKDLEVGEGGSQNLKCHWLAYMCIC